MDSFLAGRGYWVAWAAAVASAVLNPGVTHQPALRFVLLLSTVAWPLALRASALRGDRERGGRTPPRRAALLRRTTVRLRWPAAAAYGAVAAWYAQWHHDVPWLTVVAGLAAFAAVAYATGPLPAQHQ